eukprot:scaffold71215_cov33-Prasinocladus_malaysianus.AAC.2
MGCSAMLYLHSFKNAVVSPCIPYMEDTYASIATAHDYMQCRYSSSPINSSAVGMFRDLLQLNKKWQSAMIKSTKTAALLNEN